VYSLIWAQGVVTLHYRSHARASYFCHKMLDLTTDDLARRLVKNDPVWYSYKRLVEFLESRTGMGDYDTRDSKIHTDVSKFLSTSTLDGSKWLLTRYISSPMLKKRVDSAWPKATPVNDLDLPGQLCLFEDDRR